MIRVLAISNDPSVFTKESATRIRMRDYAQALGALHVISRAPSSAKKEVDGPLTLHPFHGSVFMALLFMPSYARGIIRAEHIEVVSAQDPFEYGWIARNAIRGTSAKLHVQVHTDLGAPHFATSFVNRIRLQLADTVLPRAAHIRAVSKRVQRSLVARYGNQITASSVIPIMVPEPNADPVSLPEHAAFPFVLFTMGRIEEEKRIADIIRALSVVRERYPAVGLLVVGDGSERKNLEALAKKLGLAECVKFLGWRDKDALGLLKSAHVYIQASAYEGYGRTLIEAALCHVPIITTDVGIVDEVFRKDCEALVCPVGDINCLAQEIGKIIGDHRLREMLALSARDAARTHLAAHSGTAERIAQDIALAK